MQTNKAISTVNMQTTNTTRKYIQDNITNGLMYMDNLKCLTESLNNKSKHTENIGAFDNKESSLYIYFSLGNNYNELNAIIKKVF